ncbi:dihydrofolate reductase family protein [Allonocardiopsis opalescens]|uniref:Dihydrofolate reductase n=1 Tax=Allonocardiopsis opalescens TaxID=1144618 RepID=A0A2T0PXS4_9ACTN|nr:dihydrofolate reductase family protein [Allonocardiopsis opalescens]PRX96340.1 dihydrofolate reductase [Allonocardiopsis opalescens]
MVVRCGVTVSLDGFVAGVGQSLEEPFGVGVGERLHAWMFERGEENAAEVAGQLGAGAYVMGRNMFASGRGEWDPDWKGWWGEEPPFRAPVFVLTHYPREPLVMEGGTTYTFVTDGIEAALERAREAAGDADVAIAGGAATINQYLAAGHIDELWLHTVPFTLGAGERLFDGVGELTFEPVEVRGTELVTHARYRLVRSGGA